ncbi:MAG: enoyl-CoA hydratase [Acidimicrobiaceae bacterium]|nr:enoyl-CoA hydratase [Acidimicrobiaceae bacterium]MEC7427285.1 crotonase/enoyl-CoA hydratase family protein [Actinomycetota bacterium]MEC9088508.1 crotonase/enoyl-CoA hydratase family protein [Actinomycetota bacterium]HAQ42467.1 crotonase/enoyl-CoA hydratase family protein [Acidimicrobiaceae bacterium]
MTYTCFDVETKDDIAHIRMIRPDKANSMIPEFWDELPQIVNQLSDGNDARAIVLSAEGRHFCSGMDLSVFADNNDVSVQSNAKHISRQRASFRTTALQLQRTFSCLEESRLPVLSAIQGACIGGGIDMVSATDLRYATKDAFFCIQEINIGMTADVGTLQRMPKLVPEGVVRELAYTGRNMSASEAKERGFVNEIYEDQDAMDDAVLEIAKEIASKSPMAIWGTKQTLNYGRDHSVADSLEYIATWNAAMFDPDDMAEAFMAQTENRDAEFPDHRPTRKGI